MLWKVTIPYHEPTYGVRSGDPKVYDAYYEVTAASRETAITQALSQFNELANESGVRWIREVFEDRIVAKPA
jgi:hypothetical protein